MNDIKEMNSGHPDWKEGLWLAADGQERWRHRVVSEVTLNMECEDVRRGSDSFISVFILFYSFLCVITWAILFSLSWWRKRRRLEERLRRQVSPRMNETVDWCCWLLVDTGTGSGRWRLHTLKNRCIDSECSKLFVKAEVFIGVSCYMCYNVAIV